MKRKLGIRKVGRYSLIILLIKIKNDGMLLNLFVCQIKIYIKFWLVIKFYNFILYLLLLCGVKLCFLFYAVKRERKEIWKFKRRQMMPLKRHVAEVIGQEPKALPKIRNTQSRRENWSKAKRQGNQNKNTYVRVRFSWNHNSEIRSLPYFIILNLFFLFSTFNQLWSWE